MVYQAHCSPVASMLAYIRMKITSVKRELLVEVGVSRNDKEFEERLLEKRELQWKKSTSRLSPLTLFFLILFGSVNQQYWGKVS